MCWFYAKNCIFEHMTDIIFLVTGLSGEPCPHSLQNHPDDDDADVGDNEVKWYERRVRGDADVQTQDKHEQLSELLSGYSNNGLPRMPDLLTLGRPRYDQSVFQLERHWIDIVADHDQLSKRQRDQQEAIWELLSTEVEYIRKLRAIIDVRTRLIRHLTVVDKRA